jgi:hypothetical protein
MKDLKNRIKSAANRRSFIQRGLAVVGTASVGAGLLSNSKPAFGEEKGRLTAGDAAILRFLAAAEILESDLWEQYWELSSATGVTGGFEAANPATGKKPSPTGGNPAYTAALQVLDGDMPQYINDNTDDEFSHANFLLSYLKSKGANSPELDLLVGPHFRTLPGSTATGSTKKGRLTNLTQLTVDTSFWGRYRSNNKNPDLGDILFDQAVPSLNIGKHTAIPRTDADSNNANLILAIAFTAGFHFCFIEQGGTSLYPGLAQRVTDPEVLRIVLSIGPTEAMHFQTWQDKAGNANTNPNGPPGNPPFSVHDMINNSDVTFFDLHFSQPETLQANLIMPEPCPFLNRSFPLCSIIRPTETKGIAMGAVNSLINDGLFIGQTPEFSELLKDLATAADQARRQSDD